MISKQLGTELWRKIESAQGFAFIGDDIQNLPDERVLEVAAVALEWTNETARILRKFIREHEAGPRNQ